MTTKREAVKILMESPCYFYGNVYERLNAVKELASLLLVGELPVTFEIIKG